MEFIAVGTARIILTLRADSGADAFRQWRAFRRKNRAVRLADGLEILLEQGGVEIFGPDGQPVERPRQASGPGRPAQSRQRPPGSR